MQEIENYINYIESVRSLSANTVKSYKNDLEEFSQYIANRGISIFDFLLIGVILYSPYMDDELS